jgi:hypothetical protein
MSPAAQRLLSGAPIRAAGRLSELLANSSGAVAQTAVNRKNAELLTEFIAYRLLIR